MSLKRRHFLLFLGAAASTSTIGLGSQPKRAFGAEGSGSETVGGQAARPAPFKPLKGPVPYEAIAISTNQQPSEYGQYTLQDDIVLPDGFTYDTIASWGDPVGDSRFGYNNDYLSFVPTGPNEGLSHHQF